MGPVVDQPVSPASVQLSRWVRADRIGRAPEVDRSGDLVPAGDLRDSDSVLVGSCRIPLADQLDEDRCSFSTDSWALHSRSHLLDSDMCDCGQNNQVEAMETFQVCLSDASCTHATCMVHSVDVGSLPVHALFTVDEPEDGQFQGTPDHVVVHADKDAPVQTTPLRAGSGLLLQDDLETMRVEMCRTLTPLLPLPTTHAPAGQMRNPRKKRRLDVTPRRSARLAKQGASKQQKVLIRKLCLAHEGETISEEALRMYVDLFSHPLSDMHIAAVLALFGWESPVEPLDGVEVC